MIHPHILRIPAVGSFTVVQIQDIVRLEGWQKYTRIFLHDGRSITSSYSIGKFEDQLPCTVFVRTHKSHLVNLAYIQKLEKGHTIRLLDGSSIPLARRKRKTIIASIMRQNPIS